MSRKLTNRGTNQGSNRLDYVQSYTALDALTPYQHLNRPSSETLCPLRVEVRNPVLEPDEHPDSCFVEDLALVLESRVVLTRPGHPARAAEQPAVRQALVEALPNFPILEIEAPGCLDGGDVLRVGERWFVGRSHRTNDHGFQQLAEVLAADGQNCYQINVPEVLHLKTGVTGVSQDTVLALAPLVETFREFGFRVVEVSETESHAVNVVAVDKKIILPSGYPGVRGDIVALGLEPLEVDLSEFKKQDGGATCLSLLLP